MGVYHILREVSAGLLVQLIRAMRRPQGVDRATSTTLTLFLYLPNAKEGSPAAEYS